MPDPSSDPEAVPLGLLRRYMVANGWRQATDRARLPIPEAQSSIARAVLVGRSGGRRNFDLYILSEDGLEDVEVVLPRETVSADYRRQIDGAIRTRSEIEGREPGQVITDVRMIGYDVVRSRIPDAIVYDDTIHLEVANNYIAGVKSLLAATATTEIQPDPYFLRVRKEASEYADRCRFAHTFRDLSRQLRFHHRVADRAQQRADITQD
jgi:hypothetical protein